MISNQFMAISKTREFEMVMLCFTLVNHVTIFDVHYRIYEIS